MMELPVGNAIICIVCTMIRFSMAKSHVLFQMSDWLQACVSGMGQIL